MSDRIGKYLRVQERLNGGRKTKRWALLANDGDELGEIAWYKSWRQYVLEPNACTVFNAGCLRDIIAFLDEQNKLVRARPQKTISESKAGE
uniref:Uncharacterized protein n=1 Tax=viral metagenome TaxID=1070528 RepID=A0A6M3L5P0_9ZZZZ